MPFTIPSDWVIERLQEDCGLRLDYLGITITPTDGRPPRSIIQPMSITTTPFQLVGAIKNNGGTVPVEEKATDIAKAIVADIPDQAGVLARTTGWKVRGNQLAYISPSGQIGDLGVSAVLDPLLVPDSLSRQAAGSLASWQTEVAARASASAHASLAIMASLAGCVRHFSALPESFILNFFGKGSAGKTSAVLAGASVWGAPNDIGKWDASPTGLVHMAAANSDAGFVLDDAERAEVEPKERLEKVRKMIHVFAAGETKSVARSMRDHLPDLDFRVIPLSTSPKSVCRDAFERDKPFTAGEVARLLEIGVPDGNVGGIWASISGAKTPKDTAGLSKNLFEAVNKNFGTAGPALVAYMVEHRIEIAGLIETYGSKLEIPVEINDPEVKGRIADKVRFLYATARIARRAGVITWDKAWIKQVARFAYDSIVESGFPDDSEAVKMLGSLQFIAANAALFPRSIGQIKDFELPASALGISSKPSNRLYARLEPTMTKIGQELDREISAGARTALLSMLQRSGALLSGEGTGPTRTIRLANGKPKLLEFDIAKLTSLLRQVGLN